jgi:hypothetical protein
MCSLPYTFVPVFTVASSSTTHPLPLLVTFSHGSDFGAGPFVTEPSLAYAEPWQGQEKPAGPGLTMQPRCVQTVDMANTPSPSLNTATERPGGTNASPSAIDAGRFTLNFLAGDA